MNELEYTSKIESMEKKYKDAINEWIVNSDKILVKSNDLLRRIFIDILIDRLTGRL